MDGQNNEFSTFKILLKQVYSSHTSKVKELENEIKLLKEKLAEKDRLINNSTECKRCAELESAFKSCKQALYEQSKLFENFGEKFSIFNSQEQESQVLKYASESQNDKSSKNARPSLVSKKKSSTSHNALLEPSSSKNNALKLSFATNNQNLLKNVICDNGSVDSFDVCTVTFPQHLKNQTVDLKSDSAILAPDSLDTTHNLNANPVESKVDNKEMKTGCQSEKGEKLSSSKFEIIEKDKVCNEITKTVKRSSAESLNGERLKRCNKGDQIEASFDASKNSKCSNQSKVDNTEVKTGCQSEKGERLSSTKFEIREKVKVCNEITKTVKRSSAESLNGEKFKRCNKGDQIETSFDASKNSKCGTDLQNEVTVLNMACDPNIKKSLSPSNSLTLKKNAAVESAIQKDKKNYETPKSNSNLGKTSTNITKKVETPSPSLLPVNTNIPQKFDLECISNDNDDFQDYVSTGKLMQTEDSWDICDKKKVAKKNRNLKSIKSTSKFKMTLDAPPLNYKKPNYKQTKLSKSLFQSKQHKELNENLAVQNNDCLNEIDIPTIILDPPLTSTQCEGGKAPNIMDIDATFIPDNFKYEITQCGTASVKKNTIEKSHLKNGGLFSCISFPGELKPSYQDTHKGKDRLSIEDDDQVLKENMCSFDRLPSPEEPDYKYVNEAVRKKSERKQLTAFDCKECEKYYSELGLTDKEKKERMKGCSRHRAKYTPPSTPDHFWELDFPDTEECKARGYLDATQKVKLKNLANI